MGWAHIDVLLVRGADPAIWNASARKREGMLAILIKDGQFEIAVKRG
jgi:hypothetical protein